jgi:hypothetical protein
MSSPKEQNTINNSGKIIKKFNAAIENINTAINNIADGFKTTEPTQKYCVDKNPTADTNEEIKLNQTNERPAEFAPCHSEKLKPRGHERHAAENGEVLLGKREFDGLFTSSGDEGGDGNTI